MQAIPVCVYRSLGELIGTTRLIILILFYFCLWDFVLVIVFVINHLDICNEYSAFSLNRDLYTALAAYSQNQSSYTWHCYFNKRIAGTGYFCKAAETQCDLLQTKSFLQVF